MKKILLSIILAGFTAVSCLGQTTQTTSNGIRFSAGAEIGLPVASYSNLYSVGLGVSGKVDIPATQNITVTGSAGFINYFIKDSYKDLLRSVGSSQSSAGFVPLKAGVKLHDNDGFFLEGQVGAAIGTNSGAGTAFAFSPGIGYTFTNGLEADFRYEGWKKSGSEVFSQLGLRVAYSFK